MKLFFVFQMSLIFLRPIFVVFQLYEFLSKIILKSISALRKKEHYNEPTFMCNNNNNENEVKLSKNHNSKYGKTKSKSKLGLKDVPGPFNLPFIGSSWLYSWFGPYTHKKYHESNDDKYHRYGPVVREKILFNTIIHLFAKDDINNILNHK